MRVIGLYLILVPSLSVASEYWQTWNIERRATTVIIEECQWMEGRADPFCSDFLKVSPRKWHEVIEMIQSPENPYVGDSLPKALCASAFIGAQVVVHGSWIMKSIKKTMTRREYLRLVKTAAAVTTVVGVIQVKSLDPTRLQEEATNALALLTRIQALDLKVGEKLPLEMDEPSWRQLVWLSSLPSQPWIP